MTSAFKDINKPTIRKSKPGYPEGYYDIFENLENYAPKVFKKTGINPKEIKVMEGETGVILKVFDGNNNIITKINPFPGDLFTSNYFFKKLENFDVPVPQVLYFDDSRSIIPYDFQVLDYIDGVDIRSIPEKFHHKAGFLVGEILRKIHQVKVDGFGWPLSEGGWGASSWLEALRNNYFDSSMNRKHEIFSDEEIQKIEQLTFFNEQLDISESKLIHSDVGHGNSLYNITDGKLYLVGFIDPDGLIGGDPILDVPLENSDEDFERGVWSGYTKQAQLTPEEKYRHKHLKLLTGYWSTCWHYATSRDYQEVKDTTITLMDDIKSSEF
jgi:hypothetical protein